MIMRHLARRFGRELQCHRNVVNSKVTHVHSMLQAMQVFDRNQQHPFLQWLTRLGPFWEDLREHSPDDYLECRGKVVTDTAVGEAAYCCLSGAHRGLLNLTPSSWVFSPVPVIWVLNTTDRRIVDVLNHWDIQDLEAALRLAPPPLTSWEQLETGAKQRFTNLFFPADCFKPLDGRPFVKGPAHSILARLDILDQFKTCFDEQGERTPEGHRLYREYFIGQKAWFSDSSDTEKREFRIELTSRHPESDKEKLFCSWHGKVKTPQLRIHFSWPVSAGEPLYVVYVGPKITRR